MSDSFQNFDVIILLGLVAVFVALRLRSILGRSSGIIPPEAWKQATREVAPDKVVTLTGQPVKIADEIPPNIADNAVIAGGLKAIKAADPAFSTPEFVAGAKLAFEWVVNAFAKGDKDKLRMLLSDERYGHFVDAIDARAKEDVIHEKTLVAILAADITEAALQVTRAQITVQFTSEQIHISRDKEGKVIEGDLSAIEKVIDVWTFERMVSSRDPNWKIIAT